MKGIKEIIDLGRLMWDKDLVGGWNGNISLRVDDKHLLMTGRGTCLGRLSPENIALLKNDGSVLEGCEPTSEKLLHLEVYRNFSKVNAVVHTHTPCINAFFLNSDLFRPKTYEAEYVLGEVHGIEQTSVNVTDVTPVIDRLRVNTLVALRRHGIVSVGNTLFDCMARIQVLEEQLWMEALSRIFSSK
ncbi:MAG: class II aldolase/adducin family protein [Candidatus Omnitrophica bacterium]|nr:class II aldolase/adducin family protein [Candidatus Omnitrophota bacterium]